MSPSKQKLNERQAGARDRKASARQAASGGSGASAYNPSSGTFHTLEPSNPDTEKGYLNGRFKSIDEADDTASSHGGGADVDCMSNNGSYSGESEDQFHTSVKDKAAPKSGAGGADKRDKIRGKNERKHQRQKEKRAQELKEKCTGYLMSRKLEGLSQKLVAMGFSQERATMALIVNDGHVEQSVAWLLEGGGEGQAHEGWSPSGNLKIDISEELGLLVEIEKKFKFSRPDIERAVVSCEGDLEEALYCLRARMACPVSEEEHKVESRTTDAEQPASLPVRSDSPVACQPRSTAGLQPSQQSLKVGVAPQPSQQNAALTLEGRLHVDFFAPIEEASKIPLRIQTQSPVSGVDRKGTLQQVPLKTVPFVPSFTSFSSAETGLVFGFGAPDPRLLFPSSMKDQFRNTSVRESAHNSQALSLTQMNPQPIMAPNNITTSSTPFSPCSWSHNKGLMEGGSPSSNFHVHEDMRMKGLASVKHSNEGLEIGACGFPNQMNSFLAFQAESKQVSHWNGLRGGLPYEIASATPSLPATHSGSPPGTSYGLFTGWAAGISQTSIDWSTGPIQHCDYRNIDWSMNASPTTISSHLNSLTVETRSSYQRSFEEERRFHTGGRAAGLSTQVINGHSCYKVGPSGAGMQDNISMELRNPSSHEWTSPFAGKALFNLPRAVSSPFL